MIELNGWRILRQQKYIAPIPHYPSFLYFADRIAFICFHRLVICSVDSTGMNSETYLSHLRDNCFPGSSALIAIVLELTSVLYYDIQNIEDIPPFS